MSQRGMELCSIEDAFPDIGKKTIQGSGPPVPGCKDAKASKEERRAARKRAKKSKDATGADAYLKQQDGAEAPDPDRPAVKRLGEVEPLMPLQDAFPDLSGVIRTTGAEAFKMPTLPTSACLFTDQGLPGYFGKDIDDEEEGFADYSATPGDNPGYTLIPATLDASFEGKGAAKAGALTLPTPSIVDVWKPLTPAGARTSYFQELPAPGGRVVERVEPEIPKQVVRASSAPSKAAELAELREPEFTKDILLQKIQDLTARLEDLERRGPGTRNSQREVLMFVGTGLFCSSVSILVCG